MSFPDSSIWLPKSVIFPPTFAHACGFQIHSFDTQSTDKNHVVSTPFEAIPMPCSNFSVAQETHWTPRSAILRRPEKGPPELKGGRSWQFLPLPRAVEHESPIEIRELVQLSLAMRTEQEEIRKGDYLVDGADLLQGRLDVKARPETEPALPSSAWGPVGPKRGRAMRRTFCDIATSRAARSR